MNAGLRALKKESPEAYENITGEKAMYGMKTPMAEYGKKNMMGMGGTNMYAEAGTKMPKDLIDYFEKKKAEYGAKIMAMSGMKVMGDGGKYYEHGGAHSEGGPFAAAQAQIEQNLSPLRGDLLSKIESDPKKMAWANENISGGLENASIYQLSQAADPNHSDTQTNRISRLARQSGLPVATETANLYARMNSGKFDVGGMDEAMLERGYGGEAGDVFSRGIAEGKIPLGAMISADTKDLGKIDDAGKFNFKVFDVPTGAEFLETNKRRIRNDGSIRGDNQDDLTWYAQLGRGDRRNVAPETETPETITPDPLPQTAPGDPMASIAGRGPSQIPMNRPQPRLQGGMRPLKDPTPTPTSDPGLGRFDIGALEPMMSDYTGSAASNRATGPFGSVQEDAEARIRAQQLAAMLQRSQGGRMYIQGGKVYGMGGGVKPIKNYGHGGKNC